MPKIMKIGWQLTKLLQKLSGLLFLAHPVYYIPIYPPVTTALFRILWVKTYLRITYLQKFLANGLHTWNILLTLRSSAVRRNHVCLFTDHVVTTANHRRLLVVLWRRVCRMTSHR